MRTQPIESMNLPQAHLPRIAPRDLISVHDLAPREILALFDLTTMLKRRPADFRGVLAGKQMVIFLKNPPCAPASPSKRAENRLHIQKAILVWLLGGGVGRSFHASFPERSAHA